MKLPERKILPHQTPDWVRPGSVFFVTVCCRKRGSDQLCRDEVARAIFEAVEFRHVKERWNVAVLLLMPDHWHALISFPREEEMVKVISNFKEMTAKSAGVAWQRDFFDHRLRNDESFEEKARYIRMNPVRKGMVERPEEWPWVWSPETAGPAVPPYLGIARVGAPNGRALP